MSIRAALFHSILFAPPLLAQPAIEWQKCLGGTAEDEIDAISKRAMAVTSPWDLPCQTMVMSPGTMV
ncbi:MAG: hypothetical protein IPG10_12530 [Flavobacteriales bacterium]|nr:hypothetical protein [Flavobacteriales bacterium]